MINGWLDQIAEVIGNNISMAAMAAVSLSNSPMLLSVYAALAMMLFADGWPAQAFAGTWFWAVLLGTGSLLSNMPVYFFRSIAPKGSGGSACHMAADWER